TPESRIPSMFQDLRYALRTLRRSPGFTTVALLMLAIGIGANTGIFSLLSSVFYRPLPFAAPAELAVIVQRFAPSGNTQVYISPPNFIDWTADTTVFAGAALIADAAANLSGGDQPEHVEGERISPNTFDLIGVRPALGRSFLADEAVDGRSDVVILSDMLWRRRFAADPRVVGQTLLMDGTLHTVVGVMPPGFAFPFQAKFWVPFVIDPTADRSSNWPSAVVRLHAGVRLARANAHLATVSRRLEQQYPLSNRGVSARLASLRRLLIGGEDPDELRTTFPVPRRPVARAGTRHWRSTCAPRNAAGAEQFAPGRSACRGVGSARHPAPQRVGDLGGRPRDGAARGSGTADPNGGGPGTSGSRVRRGARVHRARRARRPALRDGARARGVLQ